MGASPWTEISESSSNFQIFIDNADHIISTVDFLESQAHINGVDLLSTPEENPLENSKMTTSSVTSEENQETTNSNNNRPKVFNQKQLDHIFLSGFFMGFVICLLNPWGIFLFKDSPYVMYVFSKILAIISIILSIGLALGFPYFKLYKRINFEEYVCLGYGPSVPVLFTVWPLTFCFWSFFYILLSNHMLEFENLNNLRFEPYFVFNSCITNFVFNGALSLMVCYSQYQEREENRKLLSRVPSGYVAI